MVLGGQVSAQTLWRNEAGEYKTLPLTDDIVIDLTEYYGLIPYFSGCTKVNNGCTPQPIFDGTACLPNSAGRDITYSFEVLIENHFVAKVEDGFAPGGAISTVKFLSDEEIGSFEYTINSSTSTETITKCNNSNLGGAGEYAIGAISNYHKLTPSGQYVTIYYRLHRIHTGTSPTVIGYSGDEYNYQAPALFKHLSPETLQWTFASCDQEMELEFTSSTDELILQSGILPEGEWEVTVTGAGFRSQPLRYYHENQSITILAKTE